MRVTSLVALLAAYPSALGCAGRAASSPMAAAGPVLAQTIELETGLTVRPLGSGAYLVTHTYPWPANSLLVEMADGTLVLAATPYTPEATRRLLAWSRASFGARRMVAINNGYHVDNLGGNAALRAAGVPIYGSDLTVRLLAERGERARQRTLEMIGDPTKPTYAVHATLTYVPPDRVFPAKAGLTLRFGAEEVRGIHPGPSQAPDKLAIYFPSRELLFGGCMLLDGDRAGNIAEADLDAWPRAVAALAKLPVKIAIPAHGVRTDAGVLQNTLDVLAQTQALRD